MTSDRKFLAQRMPDFCFTIYIVLTTLGTFTGGIWAAFGIGGALLMFAFVWRIDGRMPQPEKRIFLFALAALLVTAVVNLDSTQPKLTWHVWGQLITIFLPLSLLTSPEIQQRAASRQFMDVIPVLAAVSALALGLELIWEGPLLRLAKGPLARIYQYDRGLSYAVLLAFPIMAMIWNSKRRWLIVFFIAVLFIPASYTASRAARLAFVLALLTTAVASVLPVLTRRALMAFPIFMISWPFAAQKIFIQHHDWIDRMPSSWQERMEIWDYLSYRIFERPLLGWGMGSSYKLPIAEPHGALYRYALVAAPHPHNAAIQLWVELGLPGLALGVIFGWMTLQRAGRLDSVLTPFALGAWAAAFCMTMISYNFWSDSFWAAFALTGFAFALQQKHPNQRPAIHG